MLKLIKMEMKKTKMEGYIKISLLINIALIGLVLIFIFGSISEGEVLFENYNMSFSFISTLAKITFIVFASVLLSRLIIDEYKHDTITLLFLYPINRKKIIAAKLVIVSLFTFVSIVFSNLLLDMVFILMDNLYHFVPDQLTKTALIYNLISIVMDAFTSSFMALIPLYFGLKKKSVPTTIISSLIIVFIVCSDNNGFSLSSIIAIPIIFAMIGAGIAYLSIRNIEHEDTTR